MEHYESASAAERAILDSAGKTHTPVSGSIELLPLCNMNCDMCYVRLDAKAVARLGGLRTMEEWLDIARQMRDAGTLFLLLTGGEPLLYPDFKQLYLQLRKLGMLISINTNGTLIDEEWAAFFGKYKPRRINITLYGADDDTYARLCHYPGGFEKVTRAVRLLREQKVEVRMNCSVARENAADLDRVHEIGEALGVPVRADTYMTPATRERDMPYAMQARLLPEDAGRCQIRAMKREMGQALFARFAQKSIWEEVHILPDEGPAKMHCRAGKCSYTINWQGEMRPCVVMSAPAANVLEVGFDAAWRHIVAETEKIELASACNACSLRTICRTCAACALYETGRYDGVPDYMCRYARASIEALREEAEKASKE